MKPITSDECTKHKENSFPDGVIKAVNAIIAKNWDGQRSCFKQNEVAFAIAHEINVQIDVVYRKKWLDFEDIYREAGWEVFYDKPAFNETYEANFEFRRKS